jgi:hypothetical protein
MRLILDVLLFMHIHARICACMHIHARWHDAHACGLDPINLILSSILLHDLPKSQTFSTYTELGLFLVSNRFCGLRSKWLILLSRRYRSASASILMNILTVFSDNLLLFLMNDDKLNSQSSIIM